jgi:hypothetical protein
MGMLGLFISADRGRIWPGRGAMVGCEVIKADTGPNRGTSSKDIPLPDGQKTTLTLLMAPRPERIALPH